LFDIRASSNSAQNFRAYRYAFIIRSTKRTDYNFTFPVDLRAAKHRARKQIACDTGGGFNGIYYDDWLDDERKKEGRKTELISVRDLIFYEEVTANPGREPNDFLIKRSILFATTN
jgi:hypothetical protein